jgi:pilus assembly protein CpaB
VTVRTSTFIMLGFAALFGVLAVFLSQTWLNNQAATRLKSLEAMRKTAPPAHTIVVAERSLRFGDVLEARALREVPWAAETLPAGAFGKIADIMTGKRIVLMPIEPNETVLATKITGPGQRATLSVMLQDDMKAVTIRVNDVEGVAGFVLPGDHVDVVMSRTSEPNSASNEVIVQNVRVLAIDQMADQRAEQPSVAKAVTLEVDATCGQKLALASTIGTMSLMLRKAGELGEETPRRITIADLGHASEPTRTAPFATIGVLRALKRQDYTVPMETGRRNATASVRATSN